MELKGEYRIAARREDVWALLNDADVLRACIPGCDSLEGSPADGFSARVTTKIGPVKATFNGAVKLSNVNAPESYTISGEGKGGVAGFAKGGADVHLAEDGDVTVLSYLVNAQVGGKLAQLGSRLIDSTAKKLADQFFDCFAARAGTPAGPAAGTADIEAVAAASALAQGEAVAGLPPSDIILPGDAMPSAGTKRETPSAAPSIPPPANAGSYGLDATTMPDPELGIIPPASGDLAMSQAAMSDPLQPDIRIERASGGATIESMAHDVEAEVEREAAVGFLGGPIVWALLVILALLFVYVIAT